MRQQLSFVEDKNGMLFAGFVQADDLTGRISGEVRRFQIQASGNLTQKIY